MAKFDQAAFGAQGWSGDGAAAEQVAGLQVASVHVAAGRAGDQVRRLAAFAHPRRADKYVQFKIECRRSRNSPGVAVT
jgi:hypothetical protein